MSAAAILLVPLLAAWGARVLEARAAAASPPWAALSVLVAGCALGAWAVARERRVTAPLPGVDANSRTRDAVLLVIVLFTIQAFWHYDLFPGYLFGESANTLRYASVFGPTGPRHLTDLLHEYKLGLGPLFALVPDRLRTMANAQRFTIVVYAALVAALLGALHYALVRLRGVPVHMLLVLGPPAVSSLVLVGLRRYKWHVGGFAAAIAVYLILVALRDERRRRVLLTAGFLLLALAIALYHAAILLLPVLVLALLVEAAFTVGPERRRALILALTLLILSTAAVIFAQTDPDFSYFMNRLSFETREVRTGASLFAKLVENSHSFFDTLFDWGASLPMSALFLLGASACLLDFRRDALARAHLVLFAALYGPLFVTFGTANPDENHFLMAPFLGLALTGLAELDAWLRRRHLGRATLIVALLLVALEARHYESNRLWMRLDYPPQADDATYSFLLDLQDAQALVRSARADERLLFFVPIAHGKEIFTERRQFVAQQLDFVDVIPHVRWYEDDDALGAALYEALGRSPWATRVRLYFDAAVTEHRILERLRAFDGYSATSEEAFPRARAWQARIPLRYVELTRKVP